MDDNISIPLSSPDITEAEIRAVTEVMRTRYLTVGPKVLEFEQAFCHYLRVEHAIAVSSGTAGLHCSLLALGIGPGDEVITTPFSFIASANSILMVGAQPVFVDIDPRTLNMDPKKLEAAITPRTRAIMAVEAFGNPAGFDDFLAIAQRHELPMIEDSCEGLGSSHRQRQVGTYGRIGVFAFYPNKQITTGEGGMIVTNDNTLANLCRAYRNQGRDPGSAWLSHQRMGYNYRLSDINAAIGCVQMQRLDGMLAKRQAVAHYYIKLLMDDPHIILPNVDEQTDMSWFVFVVRLSEALDHNDRDAILQYLQRNHIGASNYFPPIHLQPFYVDKFGYKRGDYPIAEYISDRTIALPFHNNLTLTEVEEVVHHLKRGVAQQLAIK
jgi:perosamine synthetase